MSDLNLDALERVCAAATEGPWTADTQEPHDMVVWGASMERLDETDGEGVPIIINIGETFVRVGTVSGNPADCEFIATARTALPQLLAEVRARDERSCATCVHQRRDFTDGPVSAHICRALSPVGWGGGDYWIPAPDDFACNQWEAKP